MVGKSVAAVVVLGIAWAAGYSYLHQGQRDRDKSSTSLNTKVLDESTIASRPIAYPLLLGIDADTAAVGLSATSEHGILTLRALSPGVTLQNITNAASLLDAHVQPQAFSVMPTNILGPVIWRGDVAHNPAHFTVATTDTGITLSSAAGRRIWQFHSPRPQFTLIIKRNRRASLVDLKGRNLWSGLSPVAPSGSSAFGSGRSVIVNTSGLTLSFAAGRNLELSDGHKMLWRDVVPNFAAIKISVPTENWGVATAYPVSGTPLLITWQAGVTRAITLSVEPGTLTVRDNDGRISGKRRVDMGRITFTRLPSVKSRPIPATEQPLFTPIAPLYVDRSTLHATYVRADGGMTCTETIHYDRNGGSARGKDGTASVTRRVDCAFLNGSSTYETSYLAPNNPRSTVWKW